MAVEHTNDPLHGETVETMEPLSLGKEWTVDDISVCASPSGQFVAQTKRRRANTTSKSSEDESIGSALRKLTMEHQLGLSLNFIILLGMTYLLFPSLRPTTKAFFALSYPAADAPGLYSQGPKDLYLVASCVIYFTAFRAFMLDYVLTPLAGICGIGRRKGRVRFAEQSYMLLYYAIYWFWGLYLFVQDTPAGVTDLNSLLISLWRDFPRLFLSPGIKLYYLSQLAFWVQQIVVIHLEERRKDHYQMLTHHFVTVGLMVGSYGYRQWRVGNAILVCMDIVDLVLPLAKILRYLDMQTACDAAFAVFVVTWVLARHVAYLAICWSIYAHVAVETMPYGVYSTLTGERLSYDGGDNLMNSLLQPMLDPEAKTISFNANIRWSFLGLLLALQCITIAWLVMIMRVVVRVVRGQGADDTRSDDEGEADGEDLDEGPAQPSVPFTAPAELEKPRFIEVETTSEEVAWPTRKNSNRKKTKGKSSGLKLGEHKEILNRIGCLSEEQLARERQIRQGSSSPGMR
jgi:acyl-CoA-dependent ceramide synthase